MKRILTGAMLCAVICTPSATALQREQEEAVQRERTQIPIDRVRRTAPGTSSDPAGPSTSIASSATPADINRRLAELERTLDQACSNMVTVIAQPYEVVCDDNPEASFQMTEVCRLEADPNNPGTFPSCNLVQREPCERDLMAERSIAEQFCAAVNRELDGPGETEGEGGEGGGEGLEGGDRDPGG